MSVSKMTVQGRSLEARNTREEIQNTKSEREKSEGEKRSPPTLFSPVHRFSYYFNWLKILLLFFFDIWTKNVFPLFRPMNVIYFFIS